MFGGVEDNEDSDVSEDEVPFEGRQDMNWQGDEDPMDRGIWRELGTAGEAREESDGQQLPLEVFDTLGKCTQRSKEEDCIDHKSF